MLQSVQQSAAGWWCLLIGCRLFFCRLSSILTWRPNAATCLTENSMKCTCRSWCPQQTASCVWTNEEHVRTVARCQLSLRHRVKWLLTGELLELLEHFGVHGGRHHILRSDVVAVRSSEPLLQDLEVHRWQGGPRTAIDAGKGLQHLGRVKDLK